MGDKVSVKYKATFSNGQKVDSSEGGRRKPYEFVVGDDRVLKCWNEAITKLSVG
jgi:FKBP-type peptidyl-prolyl cis-trans isomerase